MGRITNQSEHQAITVQGTFQTESVLIKSMAVIEKLQVRIPKYVRGIGAYPYQI